MLGRSARSRALAAGAASAAAAQTVPPPAADVGPVGQAADGPVVAEQDAVVPDPRAAAFFDVDNTVMQGASLFHLARGLYERKFFTKRDIVGFAWQQVSFRFFGNENLEEMGRTRDRALSFIAGRSVAELTAIGEEVFADVLGKVWPGTHGLAQMHLAAGQRVWLVTATPVEVATVIAQRLGLTGALGTVAESRAGVYTGRLVGEPLHGAAKAEAVRALAVREGLELERCAAYSDSANDIPLLSLVGHPCAINPDAKLRDHAKAEGWRIRDYRTGRKIARVAIAVAVVLGAAAGTTQAALHPRRRRR